MGEEPRGLSKTALVGPRRALTQRGAWHWSRGVQEPRDAQIWYLAALMSTRKFTKRTVATPDLDPATLAQQKLFARLRERSNRALLKRRRRKSGQ